MKKLLRQKRAAIERHIDFDLIRKVAAVRGEIAEMERCLAQAVELGDTQGTTFYKRSIQSLNGRLSHLEGHPRKRRGDTYTADLDGQLSREEYDHDLDRVKQIPLNKKVPSVELAQFAAEYKQQTQPTTKQKRIVLNSHRVLSKINNLDLDRLADIVSNLQKKYAGEVEYADCHFTEGAR